MRAVTDRVTAVGLSNHLYLNLAGHSAGWTGLAQHTLAIHASRHPATPLQHDNNLQLVIPNDSNRVLLARFTPDNADYLPTGEVTEVEGTEYDLRRPALLAQAVPRARAGEGFCVNFCVEPDCDQKEKDTDQGEVEDGLALVASLAYPPSGRRLEVWSDQPGLELYTANFLPCQDGLQGKEGAEYCRSDTVSAENTLTSLTRTFNSDIDVAEHSAM